VEEMHSALDQFEKFIHAASDLPPLVRLALIHYQFEAIHPFLDGNGRVGRVLMALVAFSVKG
jgi:Fic family protein